MKKIKLLLLLLLFALPLYISTPAAGAVSFNPFATSCSQTNQQDPSATCNTNKAQEANPDHNPVTGPRGILQEATTVFALVTIIAGLIILVYAGFVYVTAGGSRAGDNSARARAAQTTIVSAISGIVIASLAWLIVSFVNTHINHT